MGNYGIIIDERNRDEIQKAINAGAYIIHHHAYARGYVSRKVWGEMEEYNGRYGKGYKIHHPSYISTRYHIVAYLIESEVK